MARIQAYIEQNPVSAGLVTAAEQFCWSSAYALRSGAANSGRSANQSLWRTGQPFWQEESYDHLVRSPVEMARIQAYIEQNPVSAGLVTAAEQFCWSRAYALRSGAANSGRSRL